MHAGDSSGEKEDFKWFVFLRYLQILQVSCNAESLSGFFECMGAHCIFV